MKKAAGGTRRPLKSRDAAWSGVLARALGRLGVAPNAISLGSLFFAAAAGAAFLLVPQATGATRIVLLLAAAACIQSRLLCNLLDGMVAVEGGRKGATGEVWNDVPDRFADLMIIVPCGYAVAVGSDQPGWPFAHEIGWTAGALAVIAAYVRLLGASLGAGQDFGGPMAKPHRMALLTLACVVASVAVPFARHGAVLYGALIVLIAGTALTIALRLLRLSKFLTTKR
jgi:phosphatidylglycerophosphate synthase